jgi:hypothetical protein
MISPILIILFIIIILTALYPSWAYNSGWGYRPFGGAAGLIVLLLIFWFFFGRP